LYDYLYGWAMSQKVPVGKVKWMTNEQCQNLDKGGSLPPSFLKVYLEYPNTLHNFHKDCSFCR